MTCELDGRYLAGMVGDLTKEVASLDEATERVKALAIKARSRRGGSNADERDQLASDLTAALNQIVSAAESALRKLGDGGAS